MQCALRRANLIRAESFQPATPSTSCVCARVAALLNIPLDCANGAVARALASHHGDSGSISGESTSGPSHVGIVLNGAACRAGALGVLPLPPALAFQRHSILGSTLMARPGMTGTHGSQLERPSLDECSLALAGLYNLLYKYVAIICTLLSQWKATIGHRSPGDVKHRVDQWLNDNLEGFPENRGKLKSGGPTWCRTWILLIVFIANEGEMRCEWSSTGMQGWGKWGIPEKNLQTSGIVHNDFLL
ncbi:hypothetical protein PR048_013923 [Dryococelus australis]|uniref:Uncharacterized protein n=1 Tax=Dryococelus australis TaxID=614101 RepID=A0ABQ9HTV9_9NEOP|nr:hypothetical protein PR048_013923 [Dryococelus australis]